MNLKRLFCLLACLLLVPLWASSERATDPDAVTAINLHQRRLSFAEIKELLADHPNLRRLDMYATPLTGAQADELAELYPQVEFGWTLRIGTDHLVRTDATAFSTRHRSGSPGHSTKQMSVLRYCKKLQALDIGHNNVDDISWIAELKDLRVLIIAINKITDLTPLSGLENLEYLELFSNRVTDISPLAGLNRLMDLNIGYNRIEDFSPLYALPSLKRLWFFRAANRGVPGVPQEIIDRLKERLPDTEMNWRSEPTLGGWREHPHYDVIHEMFAGTVYLPFSDSAEDPR